MTIFRTPIGATRLEVLTLDPCNSLIFRSADEADAVQAADFVGKKWIAKRSWGYSMGKRNVNYSETEEHNIKSSAISATTSAYSSIANEVFGV